MPKVPRSKSLDIDEQVTAIEKQKTVLQKFKKMDTKQQEKHFEQMELEKIEEESN